ncbi:MAG: copper chaperone PCu(A)C [Actinomycetota bacterium]|nr:copper chaperone PCu(A)C [Actinomycetota bacterium]
MRKKVALVALFGMLLAACGGGADAPVISDARIGQPTGPNGALYFTADGYGTDDRLIGADSDIAPMVQVHETIMNDDGTMGMNHVEGLDLPADGQLVLEPGGYHVMFMTVDRLDVGDVVEVVLQWEMAGDMTLQVEVVAPGDTGG